ncbi:MAG: T9SS type A sorting domain-containing protein, partial [Cryomorphaceae bacterium]
RYAALIAANHEGGTQLWNTDLAITNLSFDNISASSPNFLVLYEADATVTVRNNGTFPVSEFYLNHPKSGGFCFATFGKMFVEETIQPGEEITIDYPSITGWRFPSASDSVYILPCVFVTNPNEEIDSNRENDSRCEGQYIFLSLDNPEVSERIKIYPNPMNREFRIESDLLLQSYEIFDAFGKRIQEGVANQGNHIGVEDLPNGIYVVKITTDKGIAAKKVVVSK